MNVVPDESEKPKQESEVICMVPLYDPKDEQDLARVELRVRYYF